MAEPNTSETRRGDHIAGMRPQDSADTDAVKPFAGGSDRGGSGKTIYGVRRSTVLMVVMFMVGIGWVAAETWKTPSIEPAETDSDSEMFIEAGLKVVRRAKQAPQNPATTSPAIAAARPLRGELVQKNPFESLFEDPPPSPEPDPDPDPEPEPEPTPLPPPKDAPPKVDHLRLGPIASPQGGGGSAYVSGQIVEEGDVIDGWTIERISKDGVVLEWKDHRHILRPKSP
ncbi:MAG: hypothetical protein GVY16_00415 [Planctomycetes bacterium]|jgi:hypothetical protein|nr:hypothetical protein [Planctomycetota bacterium]